MTNRERIMNVLHYKDVDRMPAVHFGYWSELLWEWADKGHISKEIAATHRDGGEVDRELDRIIGWDFNWNTNRGAISNLYPLFESKVLETYPDGSQRVQNCLGIIEKIKPGTFV